MKHEIDISEGIEVGPFHYKVKCGEEIETELDSRQHHGEHCGFQHLLRIGNRGDSQQFDNTFIHECMEAIDCVFFESDLKHHDLTLIAHGFAQIFKSLGVTFVYKEK